MAATSGAGDLAGLKKIAADNNPAAMRKVAQLEAERRHLLEMQLRHSGFRVQDRAHPGAADLLRDVGSEVQVVPNEPTHYRVEVRGVPSLELMERVKKQTKGAVQLGNASVYPALRALEHEGLIDSYEGDPLPERGGRPRRYYKLTALGAKAATENRKTALALFGKFALGGA